MTNITLNDGKVYLVRYMDDTPWEGHGGISSAHSSRDSALEMIVNVHHGKSDKYGDECWRSTDKDGNPEYIYTIEVMEVKE